VAILQGNTKRRHEMFPLLKKIAAMDDVLLVIIMSPESAFAGPGNQELLQDLAQANRFTMEDLVLNRDGKISSQQMFRLALQALQPLFAAVSALLGWFLFIWVIRTVLPGFVQYLLLKFAGAATASSILITFGAVGAFIVALLKTSRLTFLLVFDLSDGKAAKVEGRVSPSREERPKQGISRLYGEKENVYQYCIKDNCFEVREAGHELLLNKYDTYRPQVTAYYSPRSKLLLSVEPKASTNAASV